MVSKSQQTMYEEVNKVVALTDRVKRRKEEYRAVTPHLCAERSRLVTESWKETEGEPLDIRRAKLFKKVMQGNPVVIREGELIVGSPTKYIRGGNPCVDFNPEHTFQLFEADVITMSGLVKAAEVSEEEKASLLEDARFWKGRSPAEAIAKARHELFGDKIDDLTEARVSLDNLEDKQCQGLYPDYEKVINKGLNVIIAEAKEGLQKLSSPDFLGKEDINKYYFLQAVIIACEGAIDFAHRYAELAREMAGRESDAIRKKELEKIADTCQWVPANPAQAIYPLLSYAFQPCSHSLNS